MAVAANKERSALGVIFGQMSVVHVVVVYDAELNKVSHIEEKERKWRQGKGR